MAEKNNRGKIQALLHGVLIAHGKCVLCAKGGKGMKEKKIVSDHTGMAHVTVYLSQKDLKENIPFIGF